MQNILSFWIRPENRFDSWALENIRGTILPSSWTRTTAFRQANDPSENLLLRLRSPYSPCLRPLCYPRNSELLPSLVIACHGDPHRSTADMLAVMGFLSNDCSVQEFCCCKSRQQPCGVDEKKLGIMILSLHELFHRKHSSYFEFELHTHYAPTSPMKCHPERS